MWAVLALLAVWLAVSGQKHLVARDYVLDGLFSLGCAAALFLLATARGQTEPPDLWPHGESQTREEDGAPLLRGPAQRWLLGAVVILSALAFVSLSKNRFTLRGVVCWWAAVAAWCIAAAHALPGALRRALAKVGACAQGLRQESLPLRVNWALLAMLAILLVSLFFRLYRIDTIPTDPESDHVEASKDVQDILDGQYRIFFPRNTGREPTQFYLTAALSHVFGYGFVNLKLTMALIGALNVIPMYFLGKELLDRRLGLLAAFLTAISYWHVIISRIGLRISLAPLWTSITLYFLLRALRTGRRNDHLLTGLSLGLGLYGYTAFRMVPLLVVVVYVMKVVLDRGAGFNWRRFAGNFLVLVITSALVFLPLLRYMYDEPKTYWFRALTRTTSMETGIEKSATAVFADNVKNALLMFNYIGDDAWPEGVNGRPSLDFVSGGLLVLGVAYTLYLLLGKRRMTAAYLLVAAFVLLLPSTLSIAFPAENPSHLRASAVIPVIMLLAALPAHAVSGQVARALRGGPGMALVVVLGGMLLWQALRANFKTYFFDYRESYRSAAWNATDMARAITGFASSLGSKEDAYIICTPYWIDGWTVSLMLRDIRWSNFIFQPMEMEPHLLEPRNRLYIFNPVYVEAQDWLLANYPGGQLMRFQATTPDKDFMLFFAPVHE